MKIAVLALTCALLLTFGGRAEAQASIAQISSMTPNIGRAGDTVSLVTSNMPRNITVRFFGVQATVADIQTRSTDQIVNVIVPIGAKTGLVYVVADGKDIPAGIFTILTVAKPQPDDGNIVTGGLTSSGAGANARGTTRYAGPPAPNSKPDPVMDLPVDKPVFRKPGPPLPPPPPPPPPVPPEDPPTIYNKEIVSESASIIYVIDISGSMSLDDGSYTTPDGQTAKGNRLDRAKAQVIKSIRSLPKNFKFNVFSFDCMPYNWRITVVPADDKNKEFAYSWVQALQPQGATGTGPAVSLALFDKNNKLVVLLTDGAPNCGAGDQSGSWSCMEEHRTQIRRANSQHATINVFGIGATGEFQQFCLNISGDNNGVYVPVN